MKLRVKLTEQQARAIESRGVSIALSAGAGCGKTFVLTQRFLAGLAPVDGAEPPLHALVAITFTDRAAREMRDRIRAACGEQLKNCPESEVDHWLGVLRGLDSARISTIHSFCASLLRSQAVEAGLDPRFAVLDGPLADTLLRHTVRDSVHSLIESNDEDATKFVVQYGLERAKEVLRLLTAQRFRIDFERFRDADPKLLSESWLKQWHADFAPRLVRSFQESSLVERVTESLNVAPSKNETMMERIANLRSVFASTSPWHDPQQTLTDIQENARVQGGGGKKDWVSEERQSEVKSLFEQLRKGATALREDLEYDEADVVAAAEVACRALRLTEKVAADYESAKREQGVLDFDDLLMNARNLLRDHEAVRQRVAAGIRLLMVDEFQDTDPVQADLVRSLCGAAMTRGKLFMVGDRKQSIYRFRRADPTVFAAMSAELPESGRLPLTVNFRSQPAILNFVNQLFAPAMEGYESLVPGNAAQLSPPPSIEFLFATFDANGADARPVASGDAEEESDRGPSAAELRYREADWIARRIATLLDDPTPRVRAKDPAGQTILRRVELGDIVILFRALSSVQEYESALRRYGLEYYLVKGKAFFTQQEIYDLLNLCRYLDDCDDLVGLAGVLRSPFFNLSDDTLQALVLERNDSGGMSRDGEAGGETTGSSFSWTWRSLHDAIYLEPPGFLPEEQRIQVRFAGKVLSELRSLKDRIPLVDLLNRAIDLTGYDASLLLEFLGARKLANLRKLVESARPFDQNGLFTLKDFVTRLQTSVLEEVDEEFATTSPESGGVIRLMSIHQSKGLEFPVVIVADIDRKGPPHGGDAVLHPDFGPLIKLPHRFGRTPDNLALRMHKLAEKEADADETIRLFYVACTRASDHLILSAGFDENKEQHSPWINLVESRFDLRTGQLKFDALLGASIDGMAGRDQIPEVLVHRMPCKATVVSHRGAKSIRLEEIPTQVLQAVPGEFPPSAQRFERDHTDVGMTSVSRLEAIDQEQASDLATHGNRIDSDLDEPLIDLDMATSLGMIIHKVLEQAEFRHDAPWQDLLSRAVRQYKDAVSDDVVQQAEKMLERFFESSLIDEFAGAKSVHREIEFLLPWGDSKSRAPNRPARPNPTIAGVIDLLIETEQGWHIFDYKTGIFPAKTSVSQLLKPYEMQLGLYAHAVEQWFGVPPQELSLIAFRPTVRRITLDWTSDRWQQIRRRVQQAISNGEKE